jgi:thiosulfate/3-mercaptopyruvate sulfurtransferase
MSRYVIVGAGAVGASLAAELHTAGSEALLIARGAHLTALRADGLRYVRPDGETQLPIPVAAGPAEVELRDDDILVLATKSQDTETAVRDWAWRPVKRADGSTGLAATDVPVITLQNGLDNERVAARRFAQVLGAVIWIPASYLTPGEVVSPGSPTPAVIWLGAYPQGAHPRAEAIAAELRAAGLAVQVVDDITRWKAAKLLGNLVNALDALYAPGPLRDAALAALQTEARTVFAAAGIDPADVAAETTIDVSGFRIVDIPGRERGGSSTWQSLARAGSPETDFLNGEVALLARLAGVEAPLNAAVQARIHRAVAASTPAGSLDDADLAALLPSVSAAAPPSRETVLITAAELYGRLAAPTPPVVLDVRWALGDAHGQDHYRAGHIPSAQYVDLDTELAGAHAPGAGRHPLPDLAAVQALARRWGVNRTRGVVVYDNSGGLAAARAWWLLRWAGVPGVLLLDGGLAAWAAAGNGQATGDAHPQPSSDITLDGGHLPVLTADQAARLPATGVLLDARAAERYRGEIEPVDPRAGHIPGAVSAPTTDNLARPTPTFRPAGELRDRFVALGAGAGPVGVYCGSGVTAAHQIAALAVAGIDAALYPGSWAAWSADPDRPVAVGGTPHGTAGSAGPDSCAGPGTGRTPDLPAGQAQDNTGKATR